MSPRLILPKAALALVALAFLAGCGGDDGPKTFDEEGFAITFEYPDNFERTEDVRISQTAGSAEQTVALARSKDNAIFVQRYGLNRPVTPDDAQAVRRELDEVLARLAGTEVQGRRIEIGGPLAFRYEIERLATPEDGRSTIIVVFDGDTEYFINCQSVPEDRDELQAACERVIETLAVS